MATFYRLRSRKWYGYPGIVISGWRSYTGDGQGKEESGNEDMAKGENYRKEYVNQKVE